MGSNASVSELSSVRGSVVRDGEKSLPSDNPRLAISLALFNGSFYQNIQTAFVR